MFGVPERKPRLIVAYSMWSSVRCQDNDSFGRAPLVLTDCDKYLVTAPVCGLTLLGSVANRQASMPYRFVSMKHETSSLHTRRASVNSRVGARRRTASRVEKNSGR